MVKPSCLYFYKAPDYSRVLCIVLYCIVLYINCLISRNDMLWVTVFLT